jgi:hypothetical protein
VQLLCHLHPTLDPKRATWTVVLASAALLPSWDFLAVRVAHLDDVVALTAAVWAMAFVAGNRPGWVTGFVVLAAATKPWAIVLAPLALVLPGRRLARVAVAAGAIALSWAPFVLRGPGTIGSLASFKIRVDPASGITALHLADRVTPAWDRPTQLALGLLLTTLLVGLGRWPAVPMAGLAVRLLIDPATHQYYSVGLGLLVLAWEVSTRPGGLPWRSVTVTGLLAMTAPRVGALPASADVRLVVLATITVAAFVGSRGAPAPIVALRRRPPP